MDIIENCRQIKIAKLNHDKVICIIHGGHEYYNLPSIRMKNQYHFYVENGADAIICHHTHVTSGFEIYKKSPIFYSIGNFIFTSSSKYKEFYTGLIIKLNIEKDSPINFNYYPVKFDEKKLLISFLNNIEQNDFTQNLSNLNKIIKNDKLLIEKFENFVLKNEKLYYTYLTPLNLFNNRILTYILYKLKFGNIFFNIKSILKLNILLICESHLEGLKLFISKKLNN